MPLIIILIILVIIYNTISTYPMTTVIVLGCIAFSIVFYWQQKMNAEAAKARASELEALRNEQEAQAQKKREQQESYRGKLLELCETSTSAFEAIPKRLLNAEELLDLAEREFTDGAFSPFWDTIGKATGKLGNIRGSVKVIEDSAKKYTDTIHLYERSFPAFPIDLASVSKLDVVIATEVRLRVIVRQAQRNFQFAMIYEQHKTNDILVEGFQNLGDALFRLSEELSHSIAGLTEHMSAMASAMEFGFDSLSTELGEINTNTVGLQGAIMKMDAGLKKISAAQIDRSDQALVMLDNIQRRRLPLPRGVRDHEY